MQNYETAARDFAALAGELGLTIKADFVPFSQSRNASEDNRSLNWRVTVSKGEREILTTDYTQGSGRCPAYKAGAKRFPAKADLRNAIALECETGKRASPSRHVPNVYASRADIPPPSAADVLSSLAMDSDVLDYATYEEWADNIGYDPDSRKGEAIYRLCLSHALALRAAIGDEELTRLRDLAREM